MGWKARDFLHSLSITHVLNKTMIMKYFSKREKEGEGGRREEERQRGVTHNCTESDMITYFMAQVGCTSDISCHDPTTITERKVEQT